MSWSNRLPFEHSGTPKEASSGREHNKSPFWSGLAGRRQVWPDEVPVPGVATKPGAWILQGLELQSIGGQSDFTSVCQETLSIRGDEVRHWAPLPTMTVQPKAAVHREYHPIPAMSELSVRRCDLVNHVSSVQHRNAT